jgi:hypothetical protein
MTLSGFHLYIGYNPSKTVWMWAQELERERVQYINMGRREYSTFRKSHMFIGDGGSTVYLENHICL